MENLLEKFSEANGESIIFMRLTYKELWDYLRDHEDEKEDIHIVTDEMLNNPRYSIGHQICEPPCIGMRFREFELMMVQLGAKYHIEDFWFARQKIRDSFDPPANLIYLNLVEKK